MDSNEDSRNIPSNSKRKRKYGCLQEVRKKIKLQSHEIRPDCQCKKKCFEIVDEDKRKEIIKRMNSMHSTDEINICLAGLITILPVKQRRPRQPEEVANLRDATFSYRLRYLEEGKPAEVSVCRKAFMSVHGIGKGKVNYILQSLKSSGDASRDKRGKHKNRVHALPDETNQKIHYHINSLRERESLYSQKDSKKKYLPEELNISKVYKMFLEKNPDTKVSYETYRSIFNADFNIAFGYPRTDTCAQCDVFNARKSCLEAELQIAEDNQTKERLSNEINNICTDRKSHHKTAQQWYDLKRKAKVTCRRDIIKEAIVFDFSKNYPIPNITTGEVYYRRQLSMFFFNVHVLSTGRSVFYVYPETVGQKGSNEVCSFLHHFIYNYLEENVTELEEFCETKNHTVFTRNTACNMSHVHTR
ncbi:uncharacterized protein LOC134531565 [Bacillus rossius redtenbacheri]|uniref:uncharacterized protein LOC134531565 n=1 Tax=Bacillus rossius redtenbacheri TaxID=93214 RepID=UPI002FDEFEC8